jgi:hypothetical protein
VNHDQLIRNIQGRVNQCRRLAAATTDPHTARVLSDMANEGEADIARLRIDDAEEGARRVG